MNVSQNTTDLKLDILLSIFIHCIKTNDIDMSYNNSLYSQCLNMYIKNKYGVYYIWSIDEFLFNWQLRGFNLFSLRNQLSNWMSATKPYQYYRRVWDSNALLMNYRKANAIPCLTQSIVLCNVLDFLKNLNILYFWNQKIIFIHLFEEKDSDIIFWKIDWNSVSK
jgi:hypothetical protein